jgi:bifunctional non-homologous end joining protein LigD
VLAATREHGLEGVVAKRLGSAYVPGARNGAWVKHKHRRTESFLVSGLSPAERRRPESLLLARPGRDASLEPAGSVPCVLADGHTDEVRQQREALSRRPLGAVSASAAWHRSYWPLSLSTALSEGRFGIRSLRAIDRSSD